MTSTQPPPPPPPPPATGYERQYYPMPSMPAPPAELIVFLLDVGRGADRHGRRRLGRLARLPDGDDRALGRLHHLARHRQGRQGLRRPLVEPVPGPRGGFPVARRGRLGVPFGLRVEGDDMLTVRDLATAARPRAARGRGRRGARERGQLAPRLGAGRPDQVARGRRVPADDGPRARRGGGLAARLRPPAGEARNRRARLRHRLRLLRGSRGGRRGGGQALVPGAGGPVRGAVRRDHEGGLHAPRQRAAGAADARAGRARAALRRGHPRPRRAGAARHRLQPPRLQPRPRGRARPGRRRAPRPPARELRRRARAARSSPTARWRRCVRRARGGRSASTTGSSSTTARRRSRSSSRGAVRSAPPSCGSPATCSRTSKASGSTSARRAGAWPPSASSRRGSLRGAARGAAQRAKRRAGAPRGRRGARPAARPLPLDGAARPRDVPRRGGQRGRGPGARREDREGGPARAGRGRQAGAGARARAEPARGARRARLRRRRRRLVPRPRLARAPAQPAGRGARGVRRPRARPGRRTASGCWTRWRPCSTRAAAGATPPRRSACTGIRSATAWSGCGSRRGATRTTRASAWSCGSRSRPGRPSQPGTEGALQRDDGRPSLAAFHPGRRRPHRDRARRGVLHLGLRGKALPRRPLRALLRQHRLRPLAGDRRGGEAAGRGAALLLQLGRLRDAPSLELADKLTELLPIDVGRIFFVGGGSEAIESALKIARQYHRLRGEPTRTKFITRRSAYHGTTLGALSINGSPALRAQFEPLLPGCFRAPMPYRYRCPYCAEKPAARSGARTRSTTSS